MIRLRPYQREAVDAIHEAAGRGVSSPAVGLPTGTGKTVVFSALAQERAHLGRSLILAHRDELLRQAADKYEEVNPGADIGFVQAGTNDIDHAVVVASVQSLCREKRLAAFPFEQFATVVIDEAHHATATTYRRIVEHAFERRPDLLLVGVSATLERADGVGLSAVWKEVVYFRSLQEMIAAGYLVDARAFAVKLNYDLGQLRTSHGDFVASQVGEVLDLTNAYSVAANAWRAHADGRKAIVFTPTIATAHTMAATFSQAGIPAEAVDGEMPLDHRRAVLARFASGETLVVANAMVLTEGFDEPSVSCIIVARPTKSRPLYVQMIGRGTRLYPGKEDLVVLDLVGNTSRVDLMTTPKLFGLKPGDVEKEGAVAVIAQGPKRRAGLWDPNAGGVSAVEVDLFERKDVNWLRLTDGRWTLGLGSELGSLFLVPAERPERWNVVRVWFDRKARKEARELLGDDLDIGYAMGSAEEYLRREGNRAAALIDKSAPWRQATASEKQLGLLQKLGIPFTAEMTKGEASDLIEAGLARSRGR